MNRIVKIFLGLLIISLGVAVAMYFLANKPTVSRQKPQAKATPVDVVVARLSETTATIEAMGTVVPSQEITLRSQVSGKVVHIAEGFTPGGRLDKGQTAVRIDPRDFEIEVDKAQSSLARANADLRLEQGKQDVARQELDMFSQGSELAIKETDLALRRPQLEQAEAEVARARSDLDQAELDLSRTRVTAPFNALVTEQHIDLGSYVSSQDSLATLAGTDTYWVRASVPVDSLEFLDQKPEGGSPVRIVSQSGSGEWTGRTLRLTGEVDEATRMATLILAVPQPLDQQVYSSPLMLNDYVQVFIQGKTLVQVFSLPRRALRSGQKVWVVEDGQLDIRSVQVVWKDREHVYVRQGLTPADKVILSSLATPVQGMRLRVDAHEDQE
ncbi:MAG: efflux RND transporter periplasmic adaptor subunit [Desulfovermiculus sp.]|nr:efflux RND transporter periplasmic adaptor subunit [Desulfovermiculus sp.]